MCIIFILCIILVTFCRVAQMPGPGESSTGLCDWYDDVNGYTLAGNL